MSIFNHAQENVGVAADALMAFRRFSPEDEQLAEVGALLVAEFFALIRSLGAKPK